MSFDCFWHIPGPHSEARIREAIGTAATSMGISVEVTAGGGGSLHLAAHFDPDMVRRLGVNGDEDGSATVGEATIDPPDDETAEVSFFPTNHHADDDEERDLPVYIQALAVDRARLASFGHRAIVCASADGDLFRVGAAGLVREPGDRAGGELFAVALRRGVPGGLAVGARGCVLRAEGASWTRARSATTSDLTGVTFDAHGEAWVVGQEGAWRVEGDTWHRLPGVGASGGPAILGPDGSVWLGGKVFDPDGEEKPTEIPAGTPVFASGRPTPWILSGETLWAPGPRGPTQHELPGLPILTCGAAAADATLWIGTDPGSIARFDGRSFDVLDTGPLGRVQAMLTVGAAVVAAVDHADEVDGPALVWVRPRSTTTLHVASNRGSTRATWGATTTLATKIAELLGGVIDQS